MTTTNKAKATIQERGNGLAGAGEYVSGDDGEVYRVIRTEGPIRTGGPGGGSYVHAVVELADWSDVDDDSEPYCTATIQEEV